MAALSIVLLLFVAAEAGAQNTPNPAWDVAATTGLFVGHPADSPETESYDDWYHAPTLGISAGRYFTPNVKVEGELTLSGEGSRYGFRLVEVPNVGPRPVSIEQLTRTNSASGALVWQFFENQWVHPFLMAGATLDFDRRALHTWQQSFFRGDPSIAGGEEIGVTERIEDLGTSRRIRGLLGGGAKLYVSPRAFFRADTRIGIGASSTGHVSFRLGFGMDF